LGNLIYHKILNEVQITWLPRVYGELGLSFLAIGSYPAIVLLGMNMPYSMVNEKELPIYEAIVKRTFFDIPLVCGRFYDNNSVLVSLLLHSLGRTLEEFAQSVFDWITVAVARAGVETIKQEDATKSLILNGKQVTGSYISDAQAGFYFAGTIIRLNVNYTANIALLKPPLNLVNKVIGINQCGFDITADNMVQKLEENFTTFLGETLVLTPISNIETRLNELQTMYTTEEWIKDATYPA